MDISHITQTRIFIVKIASRCNLSCSYCYMYHHPDQSWRNQPKYISQKTITELGNRLEEHAKTFTTGGLLVVAHGGEPLLYPYLDYFFSELSNAVKSCKITFAIQTNGILFAKRNLSILKKHGVRIGVSVDGNRERHDAVRIYHNGEGSYDEVLKGIKLAKFEASEILDSVLQVIDPKVPAKEMLDELDRLEVERSDLLFPHLNYDTINNSNIKEGDIGKWLIAVFDEWSSRENATNIRLFTTIINLLLGAVHGSDLLGANSCGALMIETDGSYHIYDALKTAFPGAGSTRMNVFDTPVAIVEDLPLAKAFRDKASGACTKCLNCRLFNVCGAGSSMHRYSQRNGFDNPSVYCKDLTMIIDHIKQYLVSVGALN